MARTEVPTYTTNQLITASHGNTYWRDNLNTLWPYTTAGDMPYASAADSLARLGIGGAGSILKTNGSVPSWLDIGASGLRLKSDGSAPSWGYGAPLLDCDIDSLAGSWTSSTAQAFQDTPLSVTLTLPVAGIVFAIAHAGVQSSGGGYNVLFRMNIDSEGGATHEGASATLVPASCGHIKACSAGSITCTMQAYGYLSATGTVRFGELIAFAFPQA